MTELPPVTIVTNDTRMFMMSSTPRQRMVCGNFYRVLLVASKPLKVKLVFRLKEDEFGYRVRYKARQVVKVVLQCPGVDLDETFAPVLLWISRTPDGR